jgi:uncharacterized membrane protein YedE/YeeE
MTLVLQFCVGLIFGLGLVVSGLADPAKVYGFLDLAGAWDPSLLVSMASAVLVAALGYWLTMRRSRPACAADFQLPTATALDRRLIVGAAIFGAGWGLTGICPGPAVASIGLRNPGIEIFFPAMLIGMLAVRILPAELRRFGTSIIR